MISEEPKDPSQESNVPMRECSTREGQGPSARSPSDWSSPTSLVLDAMDLLPRILIAALFAFIFATGFYALTSWIHESLASFVAFLTLFPAFLFGLFLPEIISFIRFILSLAGTLLRLLGFPLP